MYCLGLSTTCCSGTSGSHLILGTASAECIFGGAGNNVIVGNDGTNALLEDDGDDSVYGSSATQLILGGKGQRSPLRGRRRRHPARGRRQRQSGWGSQADDLDGEDGNDFIRGGRARFAIDDTFINLRCSANLAAGYGPVFNPGERVEGFTTPDWVFLIGVLHRFGAPLLGTAHGLGSAAGP